MKFQVVENRDGSYSFQGEQPGPAEAVLAIAKYNLDKAGRYIRVRQLARDCKMSIRDEVEAEVKAEFAMKECDHWMKHSGRRIKSGREMR